MTQRLFSSSLAVIIFLISSSLTTHTQTPPLRLIVSCLSNQNWLPVHQSPSLTPPPLTSGMWISGRVERQIESFCLPSPIWLMLWNKNTIWYRSLKNNKTVKLRVFRVQLQRAFIQNASFRRSHSSSPSDAAEHFAHLHRNGFYWMQYDTTCINNTKYRYIHK